MNQIKNLKKLEGLSYFDKTTLSQFFNVSKTALYSDVNRWLKKGVLIQLKKGMYLTPAYYLPLKDKQVYHEFLANKLREPSYLSLEYVLQKYSVLTEAIYGFTSVTLKSKRIYKNKFGLFAYQHIKLPLFTGFTFRKQEGFTVKEATKAKALFDYLYFKLFRINDFTKKRLISLRLNLEEFSNKDWREFSTYCEISQIKKFKKLTKLLKEIHDY